MTRIVATIIICLSFYSLKSQSIPAFADSIRKAYRIPEIGYAVLSSTEIITQQTIGIKRINTSIPAEPSDRFRIGSNTKAITGFIAALLVKQQKISWDTRFFDLFPELKSKSKSKRAYHKLTLLDLLSFRTRLFPYSYTYDEPAEDQFTGDEKQQRYQFIAWFLREKPVKNKGDLHFSNLGFAAAAQMLEKASGKTYKELVADLGRQLGISFWFGNPNSTDTLQPWGHDQQLNPEPPGDSYKLNWLLAAGNINMSLPDYARFIQIHLQGLAGKSSLLSKGEFEFLHLGRPKFVVGWFWRIDEDGQICSYNMGNPGTFLTKVYLFKDLDRAYILFANAQTSDTEKGLDILYAELRKKYVGQR